LSKGIWGGKWLPSRMTTVPDDKSSRSGWKLT